MATPTSHPQDYVWTPQPAAAALVHGTVESFCAKSEYARHLGAALRSQTGTRLIDWVDHLVLPEFPGPESQLLEMGFSLVTHEHVKGLRHDGGMFPQIVLDDVAAPRLAIKVESVVDFLAAQGLDGRIQITGGPMSRLRTAVINSDQGGELWAVERHGYQGLDPLDLSPEHLPAACQHFESFQVRQREFETDGEGFAHAIEMIRAANRDLGVEQTCDLFFAAERQFWQRRNHAARVQKSRQDKLGLGWANHDHHTYRSSRSQFTELIRVLELLGFVCRERFYGGRDAGWGAQVLEQPNCGIVIFADVDLAPHEVSGDFAHDGLDPRDQLGTVGLWCKLHGEAFLQAGLHHLECQFDFSEAREQLAKEGIQTMPPFTDFPFLKQAFTLGETWPVDEKRIAASQRDGTITAEQASHFRTAGCLGSHLEILERNDGYKGFNQTGISEIIRDTDPRQPTAGTNS